jgi:short-chain fatty acids transporter
MNRLVALFIRWIPDAFAVALGLTLLTFLCAVGITRYPVGSAIQSWGNGFWNLLLFTNQITLTLLLGFGLANTPPVKRGLRRIAQGVHSARGAYMTACAITGIAALLSWGLSLVTAGIMARTLGERCRDGGIRVHYPLLVASSFSGFVIWHQGLTSSVGLAIATPGHFLESQIGLIPTSLTLFTAWNITVAMTVLVTLPVLMAWLRPRDPEAIQEMEGPGFVDTTPGREGASGSKSPAERMERSPWLIGVIVVMAGVYLFDHFFLREMGLELNILNFGFLFAGLALAGSAVRYVEILVEGGRVAVPFLLQYPFYAGIAAIMLDSGLVAMIIDFFVSFSSATTLPLWAFISGGVLNIFIPSGGGQWAVQGPLMMAAAQQVGADLPRVAMGVAMGDQWTNLIQPLVLVPVLAIAKIGAREIMGYTFIALSFCGIIFATALIL